jgi:uncharacterized membrane protein
LAWFIIIIIISKPWLTYFAYNQLDIFVWVTPFDDSWVTVCLLSTICADFACWFPAGVQQLGFTMFVKLLVAKDSYYWHCILLS